MAPVAVVGLPEIVAALGGELIGDAAAIAAARIDRIGRSKGAAFHHHVLSNARLQSQLASSAAGCVIVGPPSRDAAEQRGAAIVTPDPYLYFAKLTQWWVVRTREPAPASVHESAIVDPSGADCRDCVGRCALRVEAGQ